jgi:apolipoprotein N-acyltransferase
MSDEPAASQAWSISGVAGWLANLAGWRRRGVVFLLGAAATVSLPPAYFLPILYLTFPALVWTLAGARTRRSAFADGWWFGFGWFAASLYWIGNAMLIFGDRHAWMIPFAVLGLPAFLAVFTGLAGLVARLGRSHLERALWLAVGWTVMECVRGHIFTGFPWNLAGYAWMGSDFLMQFAAVVGIYGVSLAVVVSAALPSAVAMSGRGPRLGAVVAAGMILVVPWVAGGGRRGGAPPPPPDC